MLALLLGKLRVSKKTTKSRPENQTKLSYTDTFTYKVCCLECKEGMVNSKSSIQVDNRNDRR